MMNKKITFVLILLTTILAIWTFPVDDYVESVDHSGEYIGRLDPETIRKVKMCEADLEKMELCMRCAKITRSTIVYPLCCANEDNVKTWCYDYVYYRRTNVTMTTD